MNHYCRPHNAGKDSETASVRRRLGRLLQSLEAEINPHICEGGINTDLIAFRHTIQSRLEKEGWTFSYDGGNRLKVRPPGHIRPFKKQTGE